MSSPPTMPDHPVLTQDSSMLTRRFGKEVINYYAGSRLNRYSFLRSDAKFLSNAAASTSACFLALSNLAPLVLDKRSLALLTLDDVEPLIGRVLFAQSDAEAIEQFDSSTKTPLVLFLGALDETDAPELETQSHGIVRARPFFAVDATPREPYADAASAFLRQQEVLGRKLQTDSRSMTLNAEAASIYAQARSMIDWNGRHPFCAGCGNANLSVEAGYKRVCPPTDLRGSADAETRGDCPTRHGVSNVCFPRSDPTMIAAVVSADGSRILLGRQKRYPPDWYSALAGFLEPGESVEEAVRREVWEEAGVKVGRVVVHSSQPWPYPSTLMLGAIAQALPGEETIALNDKELEEARWFTIDEVRDALRRGAGSLVSPPSKERKEGQLRVPPPQAIANRLMTAVVDGYMTGIPKI